jgi:hypothetical protein
VSFDFVDKVKYFYFDVNSEAEAAETRLAALVT